MGKPNNQDKTTRRNDQAHDQDVVRANGHTGKKDNRPFSINCEWDIKQTQQFSDDGTNYLFLVSREKLISKGNVLMYSPSY